MAKYGNVAALVGLVSQFVRAHFSHIRNFLWRRLSSLFTRELTKTLRSRKLKENLVLANTPSWTGKCSYEMCVANTLLLILSV